MRSSEADARYLLSAEKHASFTPCVCPCSTCALFQVGVFQSRTVMSAELLASQRPSAEILTEETARLCAESVCVQTYRGALAGGVTATAAVARFMNALIEREPR